MIGKLFVVPTPIGNLKDITLRAIETLKSVDFILSEDTRRTGVLLNHLEIKKPLRAYHMHNEMQLIKTIVDQLQQGENIALVSDAGTPAISDPGNLLIKACVNEGIKVDCLPGATAFVPALVNSGFDTKNFCFEGFLPHKKGRQKRLTTLAEEPKPVILYESPFRLIKCLQQINEFIGQRDISVSRELTKMYEETINGTAEELIAHFTKHPPKGEIVIVIDAAK